MMWLCQLAAQPEIIYYSDYPKNLVKLTYNNCSKKYSLQSHNSRKEGVTGGK